MSTTLEDLANKVKKDHATNNLPGSKVAANEPPLEETSKYEINDKLAEEAEGNTITNGEGLAAKMNQVVANEPEENDDFDVEESESVINSDGEDDEDDYMAMIIPDAPEPIEENLESDTFEITDDEIKEAMPDIPEDDAIYIYENIRLRTVNYRNQLIFQKRTSRDEATEKAISYMKEIAEEENVRYLKKHPNLLVLSVNKEDEKNLEFTEEEKDKIVKAKVIKLEVVETKDLPVKKIRKVDKRNKLSIVQNMDRYMSQYSVPLPTMNDFVTFKGAQLVEINNLRVDKDTTILEITEKKANLIYKQLIGGSVLRKYDENGKTIMYYQDFLNAFPINDLDLAVYGVMVASSMEEMETEIPCDDCNQYYTTKYNLKTLLTMKGLTDEYKDRFEEILDNKDNADYLKKMFEKHNKTHIIKSPITNNIYEIDTPSIARAIGLYQHLDMNNEIDVYFSAIYQYIGKILMYDNEKDDYIPIEENEYQELFAAIRTLPQTELNLLGQFISPMIYQPHFALKSKCEHCGFNMETPLSMNDLVFLATQGSPTETRLSRTSTDM